MEVIFNREFPTHWGKIRQRKWLICGLYLSSGAHSENAHSTQDSLAQPLLFSGNGMFRQEPFRTPLPWHELQIHGINPGWGSGQFSCMDPTPFSLFNLFCFSRSHSCLFTTMCLLTNSEPVSQILTAHLNITLHSSNACWPHALTSPTHPFSLRIQSRTYHPSFPAPCFSSFLCLGGGATITKLLRPETWNSLFSSFLP